MAFTELFHGHFRLVDVVRLPVFASFREAGSSSCHHFNLSGGRYLVVILANKKTPALECDSLLTVDLISLRCTC